ncbi:MAG: D-tyrosyl-tRNA(Tyr) deacylase [Vallitaleaceae bacterium]|nr:D-tyrosyl-tRNA(Tyr) deacylase [Vallitaleaceae bacterium]
MRFLVQRVSEASVEVENNRVGSIGQGFLVFIGITHSDTMAQADYLIKKLLGLRIFEDAQGKTNRSIEDVKGSLLLISQFTLYADTRKGNRPSFTEAAGALQAKDLYEYIIDECKKSPLPVEKGIFGADMKVHLINDGPFTVLLEAE